MALTALKSDEIKTFRRTLLDLRTRLRGDLEQMTDEALKRNQPDSSGNLSNMPLHMADLGTENYDQEFTLGLIKSEQTTLDQIHDALERIDAGAFGRCPNVTARSPNQGFRPSHTPGTASTAPQGRAPGTGLLAGGLSHATISLSRTRTDKGGGKPKPYERINGGDVATTSYDYVLGDRDRRRRVRFGDQNPRLSRDRRTGQR